MDLKQIAYFQDRYSRMSDEELATLVVTRRDMLSEEAVEALQRVLDRRDVSTFLSEVNEKATDVKAQVAGLEQQRERQRATIREIPRAMLVVVAAAIAIFAVAAFARSMTWRGHLGHLSRHAVNVCFREGATSAMGCGYCK